MQLPCFSTDWLHGAKVVRTPNFEFKDKRRLRSENSRRAIVLAALDLLQEGMLQPSIQQIAARAAVGERTYFRHFSDMDELFEEVHNEIYASSVELFKGGDRSGLIGERIEKSVRHRTAAFEQVGNLILATQVMFWDSEALRENLSNAHLDLRKDLEDWLPELKNLAFEEREAIVAVASFDNWRRLRKHQNLAPGESREVIVLLLRNLLNA